MRSFFLFFLHFFTTRVLPLFLALGVFAGPALAADCPPFPEVPWWKNLSHESVRNYVAAKHGGDWNAYIVKWEKQYAFVKDVYLRGSVVIVSADQIKLRDEQLLAYIGNIKDRLTVIRCLAGKEAPEQRASSPASDTAKKAVSRNDPVAGGNTAHALGCDKCHGDTGVSEHPAVPNLAGQNDMYLVKQIKEFQAPPREGVGPSGTIARHSPVMSDQVKELNEAEIWNLAAFYASNPCQASPYQAEAMDKTPAAALPCIQCHGVKGASVFPEVPNLAGQNRNYLAKQLSIFKETALNSGVIGENQRFHYLMAEQARNLSEPEIEELANFFSGLTCQ